MINSVALCASTSELVAAAQCRPDADNPALERLLEENEGLFRRIVLELTNGRKPIDDDLLQVARLGFVRAVRAFRPGTASLSTFARSVVYRSVLKEARRQHRHESRLPKIRFDKVGEPVADDDLARWLERFILSAALASLPARDRELLTRLYDDDRSQSAVAVDLGVSHTAVHKRHRRILTNLRSALSA